MRFWKENHRQGDRTGYYVEAKRRQGGLSVGGTFQGSTQHADYVVRTVRLLYEALHAGALHLEFEIRVDVPTSNDDSYVWIFFFHPENHVQAGDLWQADIQQ